MTAPTFFTTESKAYATSTSTSTSKTVTSVVIPAGARTVIAGGLLDLGSNTTASNFTFNDGSRNLDPFVLYDDPVTSKAGTQTKAGVVGVYDVSGAGGSTNATMSFTHAGTSANALFFVVFSNGYYARSTVDASYRNTFNMNCHSAEKDAINESICTTYLMDQMDTEDLTGLSSRYIALVDGAVSTASIFSLGLVGQEGDKGLLIENTAAHTGSTLKFMTHYRVHLTSKPDDHLTSSIIK